MPGQMQKEKLPARRSLTTYIDQIECSRINSEKIKFIDILVLFVRDTKD